MDTGDQLTRVRHSLAHLLAIAVKEKNTGVKLGIGPVIESGFYYDFAFSSGYSPSPDDLKRFEARMRELIAEHLAFTLAEVSPDEAHAQFKDEPYKLELINELVERGEKLTTYTSGSFNDLCVGPHVANTSEINPDAFAITHTAGAYWRGDEKNAMLTRIYGAAFATPKELAEWENLKEEAALRDHRKLGRELGLFAFSDLVGSGLPLFTPKGTLVRDLIVEKIQTLQKEHGYERVTIPHITKRELYETSGHWEKFKDDLFYVKGRSETEFVMKPMNCPHHTQIYASAQRSYKELPIRYMETTAVYRDEQQGELLGLSRVRAITQDDGHVFCRLEQVGAEVTHIIHVIKAFYTELGMFAEDKYRVSLSVRDMAHKEKYLGEDRNWAEAEAALEKCAKREALNYKRVEGEAAFYGPKLDFIFKDSLGREWQLGTVQIDFVMPERFGLEYTAEDGSRQRPVMIHRAIAGSLERFMAIMIEHFGGAFPLWLAPVQAVAFPVGGAHKEYAREVTDVLKQRGVRAELDERDESLGKRIRDSKLNKIPYLLVVGDKELASHTITAESREGTLGALTLEEFVSTLK